MHTHKLTNKLANFNIHNIFAFSKERLESEVQEKIKVADDERAAIQAERQAADEKVRRENSVLVV